jgi:hypothetical protein
LRSFSKRTVDALKPADKSFIAYDAALEGLGVRVRSSGAKSRVIEYRQGGGGRKVGKCRSELGTVGDPSPDEARKAARIVLSKVQLGPGIASPRRSTCSRQGKSRSGQCYRRDVPVQIVGDGYCVSVRGPRSQIEAQYAIIKAFDRVARRLGGNPEGSTPRLLDREAILTSLSHGATSACAN